MAPEIKEGRTYDGKKSDMFSIGVILFVIVQGIFPFKEATKDECYYSLIKEGLYDDYWIKTRSPSVSDDFEDLIFKMLSYDVTKRPTIHEVRDHPWMNQPYDPKIVK